MITPTLKVERRLWRDGMTRVVGVDEVGVAPTCGAVVAAAVVMAPNCRRIAGVRDSKTLSAAQRERLAPIVRRRAIAFGVGAASVGEIDRLNIYHATHLAMRRAVARVGVHDHVLVDGLRIARFEEEVGPYTAIVDGDAHVYSIACASILAKVVRDRMMARLAARHPGYGWERNQGYATREHRDAIRRLGLTPFHRRSFLALQRTLAGDQATLGLFAADDALGGMDAVDLAAAVELGRAVELPGPADDADDGGHPGAEHDRPDVSKPGVLAPAVHGAGGIDVLATPVDLVIADLRPPEIATEA